LHRLYKCDYLSSIPSQIDKYLGSFSSNKVVDIYFATLLNNSADKYGSKANKDFAKAVSDSTKKVVSENFNKTSLGYSEGEEISNGITVKSLRAMNLLRLGKDDGFVQAVGKLAK
jgi:hypothetical protein